MSAFATSYIPTTSASATRAVDVVTIAGTLFNLSATAGTLYVCGSHLSTAVSVNAGVDLYLNSTNKITQRATKQIVQTAGVSVADLNIGSVNTDTAKRALAYATDDFAGVYNGGAVSTDATGSPPAATSLRFDVDSNAIWYNGHIRQIMHLPRRMANADLQTLTT